MRVQSLVLLATLAIQGSIAQPAHRHAHHHKRRPACPALHTGTDAEWEACKDWEDENIDYNIGKSGAPEKGDIPVVQGKYEASTSGGDSGETKANEESEKKGVAVEQSSQNSAASKDNSDKGNSENDGGSGNVGDCSNLEDLRFLGSGNSKRAEVHQDNYVGNTGGDEYGSNMQPVKDCNPEKAGKKNSLTITNEGEESDFWIWNKVGKDGRPMSGMMGVGTKVFKLKKGQSACFAMESNTQMGFSKAIGRDTTRGGVPNGNVGEANFDDQSKDGEGSLYNVSMVTYNEIAYPIDGKPAGKPVLTPMTISAKGLDDSTTEHCVYTKNSQNYPTQPWPGSKRCNSWAPKGQPFHVRATVG